MAPPSGAASPLPYGQLALLFLIQLAEPLQTTVIYPFLAKLVHELNTNSHSDNSQTGYYSGLFDSCFFLAEAAFVLFWGRLSDRVGRKPILMSGLIGLAISMISFGFTAVHGGKLWKVVLARAAAGVLSGNVGVRKGAMAELTDRSNIAQAVSVQPFVWNLGCAVGQFIGGGLEHPFERVPKTWLGHSLLFKKFPYLLPCGAVAVSCVAICGVTAVWFRETLKPMTAARKEPAPCLECGRTHYSTPEVLRSCDSDATPAETTPLLSASAPTDDETSIRGVLSRWFDSPPPPLRAALIAYSLLALIDIGFLALLPLFFASSSQAGGIGLPASTIGILMGIMSTVNALVQGLVYPKLHKRLGERRLFVIGAFAFCAMWPTWIATWGLAASASHVPTPSSGSPPPPSDAWRNSSHAYSVWIGVALSLSLYVVTQFSYSSIFIAIAHASQRSALGSSNGLAQMCASAMRGIGPALITSFWAWSMGWLHIASVPGRQTARGDLAGLVAQVIVSFEVRWPVGLVFVVLEMLSVSLVLAGTRLEAERGPNSDDV